MRHSGAGQPSVCSGKLMVAKGKKGKNSESNGSNRWQSYGFAIPLNMILKDWKAFSPAIFNIFSIFSLDISRC